MIVKKIDPIPPEHLENDPSRLGVITYVESIRRDCASVNLRKFTMQPQKKYDYTVEQVLKIT